MDNNENRWTPVSEKLPEVDQKYIVTIKYGSDCYGTAEMRLSTDTVRKKTVRRWHWNDRLVPYEWEVIAWMEKPEPYRENDRGSK